MKKKIKTVASNIIAPLRDLCTIWADELKMVFTDEGALMFMIVVPFLYPLLYSWMYNNEVVREVPVAIIDKNHTSMSREYIRMFDAAPDTRVAYYCNSLSEAEELVGRQKVHGALVIPSDFDLRLNRGDQTTIDVYVSMSLMLTYKAIYQTALAVATDINSGIQIERSPLGTTERDDELTTHPMEIEEVPIFNPTGGYGNALLPGVLIVIIQQTLLLGIGLTAGTSRERNRYQALIPISHHYNGLFRIVGGKALCYLLLYSVITAYLTLVVPRLFHFTIMAEGHTLMALMLPYLLSCIFFGMTVSCLVRYRENVMLIVVFTSVIFLFMTGISWPETNIPGFWKGISWLFPSTFGVQGFLKTSSMGGTLADVTYEYRALWIQTIFYFLTTCIVYGFQLRNAKKYADI